MSVHLNYIAGEWIAGSEAAPSINPSSTADVIGEYARVRS